MTRWATGSTPSSRSCPSGASSEVGQGVTGNPSCDDYRENGWAADVVYTDKGEMLTHCLNPYNQTHQDLQNRVGRGIAIAATLTFVLTGILGLISLRHVRNAFRNLVLQFESKS